MVLRIPTEVLTGVLTEVPTYVPTTNQQAANKVPTKYQHSSNTLVTTDKKRKKYSSPIREKNTAPVSVRLEGNGYRMPDKERVMAVFTAAAVTAVQKRAAVRDCYDGV